MATRRATIWAFDWRAMPIDRARHRAGWGVLLTLAAALSSGGAWAAEEKPPAAGHPSEAEVRDTTRPPAGDDEGASSDSPNRPAPVPLIVPSEEVSADSAVSFPADI